MKETFSLLALYGLRALSWLPLPVLRALGFAFGLIVWALARRRRGIALTNLASCFPDWAVARRRAIAREHFQWYLASALERFIFWFGSPRRIRRLAHIEGLEHLEAVRGQPLILLAPHFLGLDAGGLRLQLETGFVSMYARQSNEVLTEWTVRGRSRFNGAQMVLRQDGFRAVIRALRDGMPFYFLPDMDLGARDAVFVPFFGVPAATVTSVSRLSRMTQAVVLPCVTEMVRGGYRLRLMPAWPAQARFAEGAGSKLAEANADEQATRALNAFLEQQVLKMPAQYLWTHRRFKTRPPGEPPIYGR